MKRRALANYQHTNVKGNVVEGMDIRNYHPINWIAAKKVSSFLTNVTIVSKLV